MYIFPFRRACAHLNVVQTFERLSAEAEAGAWKFGPVQMKGH